MSLYSPILESDTLGVKWAKLQRSIRLSVDNAGITYTLGNLLTDIRPNDSEGVKWAKLGAWIELLANNVGPVGGGVVIKTINGTSLLGAGDYETPKKAPPGYVDITEYGAVSGQDCTTAFNNARAASNRLWIPAGTFGYNGNGLDWAALQIKGVGRNSSTINIGAGKSLVVGTSGNSFFSLEDIGTSGGYGAIRLTGTGASVGAVGQLLVRNCDFYIYTGAAISHLFSDCPNWLIEGNSYYAANDTAAFGIVLSGDSAHCIISKNSFGNNFAHIKLRGKGGSDVAIENNDFVRANAYVATSRYDIWIVPNTVETSSFFVNRCKFGPENRSGPDSAFLFADEDGATGTSAADRLPLLSSDSTGYVSPSIGEGCSFGANSSGPVIYSTTPRVQGAKIESMILEGALPTYFIQFRTPSGVPAGVADRIGRLGAPINKDVGRSTQVAPTNSTYPVFDLVDPDCVFALTNQNPLCILGGGDTLGYVNTQNSPGTTNLSMGGGNAKTNITDGLGGADAIEVLSTVSLYVYAALTGRVAGALHWIEFDVAPPATGVVATDVMVQIRIGGSTIDFQRMFSIPAAGWRKYRFQYNIRDVNADQMVIQSALANSGARIGRLRTYLAREPIPYAQLV